MSSSKGSPSILSSPSSVSPLENHTTTVHQYSRKVSPHVNTNNKLNSSKVFSHPLNQFQKMSVIGPEENKEIDENYNDFRNNNRPRTYLEKIRQSQRMSVLLDPNKWQKETRDLLNRDYSVPLPTKIRKRTAGSANQGRKINTANFHKTNTLPSKITLKQLTENDLKDGIINLIHRKIIPSFADQSLLVSKDQTPMISTQAKLHPYKEQFVKRTVQTLADTKEDMGNFKLDIINAPLTIFNEDDSKKETIKVSLNPPVVPFGNQKIYSIYPSPKPGKVTSPTISMSQTNPPTNSKNVRNYLDLMDEYSLHHVIIRHGSMLSTTPEFISYQRTFEYNWGNILTILKLLEKLFKNYGAPLVYVDGKKVAKLAELEIESPSVSQLLGCVVNYDTVAPLINLPEVKYKGRNGKALAAITIQRHWKGYIQRKRFQILKMQNEKAKLIQRQWFVRLNLLRTREKLKKKLRDEEYKWRAKMDDFKKNWDTIKKGKRVIIHMNSLSFDENVRKTFPKFKSTQNSQILRLFDLIDPNVEIIYITMEPLDEDAIGYAQKLLELVGIEQPMKRVKFIVPENTSFFSGNISLAAAVYYSARTIRHIRTLVMGKKAYIIAGRMGKDDLRLAVKLQVPILGPDPVSATVYGTKSGSKRIFTQADVNVPPGAHDIIEESELLLHLSKKILEVPQYKRWIIKIDNESYGRGHAFLDTSRIKCLSEDGKHKIHGERSSELNTSYDLDVVRDRLYFELKDFLHLRAHIVSSYVYPNWSSFIKAFKQAGGGSIEAIAENVVGSPTVNLFIEPNGDIKILSVQEQLIYPQYCCIGAAFPHYSVPFEALREASVAIARVCYTKKIIGYISIDYIAFVENENLKIWAVDLKLQLTDNSLFHRIFEHLTQGHMDPQTGFFNKNTDIETHTSERLKKSYVFCHLIRHPMISSWHHPTFFHQCKQRGFSFDAQTRNGIIFQITESLLKGQLGVLCISKTAKDAIMSFSSFVEFISSHLNNDGELVNEDSNVQAVVECSRELANKINR
ncbi:hypothetical protein ABK040_008386 [Willaertia magna]